MQCITQGWSCKDNQMLLGDVVLPPLLPHEVRILVQASGVSRADVLQKEGHYRNLANPVLGLEVAGVVIERGSQVSTLSLQDRVMALVEGGGYSLMVNAVADLCFKIPPSMTFSQAAGLPEAIFTWWNCLYQFHSLSSNHSLLIHGGASGIGTIGIQLARLFDAKVFVTVSNTVKADLCCRLGAFLSIIYTQDDFVSCVMDATELKGVDYIVDCVGGEYVERNLKCLTAGGKLIMIAAQGGIRSSLNLAPLLLKNLTIVGSTLRDKALCDKVALAHKMRSIVDRGIWDGSICPVIFKEFSFNAATEALSLMESRGHHGKIVLNIR